MVNLKITGMTCGHCVRAVTGALKGVPGVKAAEVDLRTGSARVEGAPDPAALLAAVAEEGYKAEVLP
ncbi:MAG TPA: cation transporter [Holophagaceae bacterium]|nr:cation transporter [Holophagaceae bacterium]